MSARTRLEIASVGIVTKDRPRALERALSGYIENSRRFGRRTDFVVADDSRRMAAEVAERLRRLKRRHGARIFHAAAAQKRLFIAHLARQGIEPRAAAFALLGGRRGPSFGANRNALLLHAAGEAFFSPDDDVECRLARPPRRRAVREDGPQASSEEFWFFESRAAALRAARFEDGDVLAVHERFLGRAGVLATLNGVVGDCALASPRLYLRLQGASRKRLTGTPQAYRAALSRQVIRAAARPAAPAGAAFMTTAAAYDNRALLPPFAPMFRNEDGLFGLVLRRCFEAGRWLHLPWIMPHAPPKRRRFRPGDYADLSLGHRANDLLHLCLLELDPGTGPGAARLRRLGRGLSELGAGAPADFRDFLQARARRARALQILHWNSLLRRHHGEPGHWAADVRGCIASLERSLEEPALPAPLDAGSWAAFQRFAAGFGALLEAWPDMVDASKRLRARGIRLAAPV